MSAPGLENRASETLPSPTPKAGVGGSSGVAVDAGFPKVLIWMKLNVTGWSRRMGAAGILKLQVQQAHEAHDTTRAYLPKMGLGVAARRPLHVLSLDGARQVQQLDGARLNKHGSSFLRILRSLKQN